MIFFTRSPIRNRGYALLTRSDAYEMLYFSDMMIHLDYTDAIKMRERYKNYGTGSFWMRKR